MAGLVPLFLVLLVSLASAQDFTRFVKGADESMSWMYASGSSAVLFDTQLTQIDNARISSILDNQILNTVANTAVTLRYIVVTSTNPRSFLGLAFLAGKYPSASIIATPGVANFINANAASIVRKLVADNVAVNSSAVPRITAVADGSSITVGGTVFTLNEISQVAAEFSTYIWSAATRTLFPGFVHWGLHPDLSYTVGANGLQKYAVTLRNLLLTFAPINTLFPRFGFISTSPTEIETNFVQKIHYIDDFRLAVAAPNTRAQAIATLQLKYPVLGGQNFLEASVAAAIPACKPSCGTKTCGSDGCGGSCGSCVAPNTCNSFGQCACVSQCNGKFCGDDGCGKTCGTCKFGTCGVAGQCMCTPSCPAGFCGADGCGGVCGCAAGTVCTQGFLCQAPTGNSVGLDLNFRGLVTKAKCQ